MSAFEVHVLASGSKGNAIYIRAGETSLLIDAGISARRITNGLAEIGVKPADVSGVLLTHEHSDHVSGLPVFCRKYGLPVFAKEATWYGLSCRREIAPACCRVLSSGLNLGELSVEPFSIPHDAADPVGFMLRHGDDKCTVATDVGFVTDTVRAALEGSDVVVLEANHDVNMLKNGSYPRVLQQRILSNRGHLSNADAGWTLAKLPAKPQMDIFLAHLSHENNTPSLAYSTVRDILAAAGRLPDVRLFVTSQERRVTNCITGGECDDEKTNAAYGGPVGGNADRSGVDSGLQPGLQF